MSEATVHCALCEGFGLPDVHEVDLVGHTITVTSAICPLVPSGEVFSADLRYMKINGEPTWRIIERSEP